MRHAWSSLNTPPCNPHVQVCQGERAGGRHADLWSPKPHYKKLNSRVINIHVKIVGYILLIDDCALEQRVNWIWDDTFAALVCVCVCFVCVCVCVFLSDINRMVLNEVTIHIWVNAHVSCVTCLYIWWSFIMLTNERCFCGNRHRARKPKGSFYVIPHTDGRFLLFLPNPFLLMRVG